MSWVDVTDIDRSVIKWDKDKLKARLRELWTEGRRSAGRGLRIKFTVHNYREVGALRREFDYGGYHLRMQTEAKSDDMVVWITQKYRGNRPGRT